MRAPTVAAGDDVSRAHAHWDAGLDPGEVFHDLAAETVAEIGAYLAPRLPLGSPRLLREIEALEIAPAELARLAGEVASLQARLHRGRRFAVVRAPGELPFEHRAAIPWLIARLLGDTLVQNEDGHHLYLIADRGGKMEHGARYSQTNQGGSFHTDGVNLESGYDYFLLSCLAPAERGGESVLVSGHSVHRELREKSPETLRDLGREFVWEFKGIYKDRFYRKAILSLGDGVPRWHYLRNYLEEAAAKQNEPLSEASVLAMDRLDGTLGDPRLQFRHRLGPGETVIVNDKEIFHGRTPFEDRAGSVSLETYLSGDRNDLVLQRSCTRIWVNARTPGGMAS